MTIQILTAGRKEVGDFFKLSDVFTADWLTHTRVLVTLHYMLMMRGALVVFASLEPTWSR